MEFIDVERASAALEETRRYWTQWPGRLSLRGSLQERSPAEHPAPENADISPTGAIVAAPTTSLPEVMGGTRNWDYRLSWIRASQFVITALMHCGYDEEAHEFFRFLKRAADGPDDQLYDIRGEAAGDETEMEEMEGHRCSEAAVLRMPLQDVVPADDPRMLSTIKQVERLFRNGLLMRYSDSKSQEGAFTSCSLWLINNYILLACLDQAREGSITCQTTLGSTPRRSTRRAVSSWATSPRP